MQQCSNQVQITRSCYSGELYTWGAHGLGLGSDSFTCVPSKVNYFSLTRVHRVWASGYYTIALADQRRELVDGEMFQEMSCDEIEPETEKYKTPLNQRDRKFYIFGLLPTQKQLPLNEPKFDHLSTLHKLYWHLIGPPVKVKREPYNDTANLPVEFTTLSNHTVWDILPSPWSILVYLTPYQNINDRHERLDDGNNCSELWIFGEFGTFPEQAPMSPLDSRVFSPTKTYSEGPKWMIPLSLFESKVPLKALYKGPDDNTLFSISCLEIEHDFNEDEVFSVCQDENDNKLFIRPILTFGGDIQQLTASFDECDFIDSNGDIYRWNKLKDESLLKSIHRSKPQKVDLEKVRLINAGPDFVIASS
ncbi:hypothetical protein ROZALSC1DRAFT_26541 [Rozella allomycis CSF55]|uniref:Uncharacterized protein n=1 Tax=Rozella allomycis (strain CSF55) TaxID=988480 RepID=A0A4P9YR23_ROZAC|nr:hypothetical protein ROZALSC1DRAFT_26541 [Rozella allomycis CSF55]